RILIGARRTGGHGVGKINEVGAELAREDGDKVVDAIRAAPRFYETHAFLLIAGAGGGTGSGAISVIAQMIKDRYVGKPLYALCVLPFEHEQATEVRTVYNAATCLKSIKQVADAVFLADNQRYVRKDASLANNLDKINRQIVEPFYDLLCAGEVTKTKHVGAKVVDAGDIMQTLEGWTAIGVGRSEIPTLRLPWRSTRQFRAKTDETLKGVQTMDAAISELSVTCNPRDAGKAMYLLAAPSRDMTIDIVKGLGDYLRELTDGAIIRGGDFPGERSSIDVTVVLSQLANVQAIREYYERAGTIVAAQKQRAKETQSQLKDLDEIGKQLPTLM
ncbi:MAG: cell division protein FtsZ, partial [Dehalococcoidia bacterium]|nr:cell division protein FtsZ [Dehalococcoidia bacterium]